MRRIFALFLALLATHLVRLPAHAEPRSVKPAKPEVLVNAIVASVDGKPITLRDIAQRMSPPRPLTLKEASLDPEANAILDALIMESLVLAEAETRRLSVAAEDIDNYIEEVAKRNNLSRDGFEKALAQEGKDLESYKQFVKVDILKSRLASSIMQSGAGVTEKEIDEFMKEHGDLASEGAKMKLARILVSDGSGGEENARAQALEVKEKLNAGAEFEEIAAAYSDGSNQNDSGILGIIATKDLSSDVFEAVSTLKPGEASQPVRTAQGFQVFYLMDRYAAEESSEESEAKLRQEVRKRLQRQKLEERMNSFFTAELLKSHAVDRKI